MALSRAVRRLFPGPFRSGRLKGFDGVVEILHGGVGEAEGVNREAVHRGGECEG